jgi:archaemetzincin
MNRSFLFLICIGCWCCNAPTPVKPLPQQQAKRPVITRVQLMPLGYMPPDRVSYIGSEISKFYRAEVLYWPVQPLPASAYYAPRGRYRADSLLGYLLKVKQEGSDYIVGITEKDISTTSGSNPDWGVFGLGLMPGRSCVASVFRLKKNVSEMVLRERLAKVVLHEMGHNFGLPHCPNMGCMMADAEGKLATVEQENKDFCTACRAKIAGFLR